MNNEEATKAINSATWAQSLGQGGMVTVKTRDSNAKNAMDVLGIPYVEAPSQGVTCVQEFTVSGLRNIQKLVEAGACIPGPHTRLRPVYPHNNPS